MNTLHTLKLYLLESECETWLVVTVCVVVFVASYGALKWIDKKEEIKNGKLDFQ